jgi:hypothetical protein
MKYGDTALGVECALPALIGPARQAAAASWLERLAAALRRWG